LEYLLTFTKEYLAQVLLKSVKFEQDHISKIKVLRKKNKVIKKKKETLQRSCENLHAKINEVQNEKIILQNKFDDSYKSLLKFTKCQENLDELLGSQFVFLTKKALHIILIIRKDHIDTSLLKRHHKRIFNMGLAPKTVSLVTITKSHAIY